LGFTVSFDRATTSPSIRTTLSARSRVSVSNPLVSGEATNCVTP
jgi:hypothetical protein